MILSLCPSASQPPTDHLPDVVIRYCRVDVRFANSSGHSHNDRELQAFNTDGFDLAGSNIHIHE